jgi:hypothetical protein
LLEADQYNHEERCDPFCRGFRHPQRQSCSSYRPGRIVR